MPDREKAIMRVRRWQKQNPEKVREYYRRWAAAHPEAARERCRQWKRKNRERVRETHRRWRARNPGKSLEYHRKRQYGLTPKDFMSLLTRQKRRCAICRKRRELVIDHSHKTGRVRGLLCGSCNSGLGMLGDSRAILIRATKYISKKQLTLAPSGGTT